MRIRHRRDIVMGVAPGRPLSAAEPVSPTGNRWMEAVLRLSRREAHASENGPKARPSLKKALDFYRSVDASHTIATIELLASTQSESA